MVVKSRVLELQRVREVLIVLDLDTEIEPDKLGNKKFWTIDVPGFLFVIKDLRVENNLVLNNNKIIYMVVSTDLPLEFLNDMSLWEIKSVEGTAPVSLKHVIAEEVKG